MNQFEIPSDATIEDVVPTLSAPVEYHPAYRPRPLT
jgi:hypothetical protein